MPNESMTTISIPDISGDNLKATSRRPAEVKPRRRGPKSPAVGTAQPWETCCPGTPHADEVDMLRDHLAHRDRQLRDLQTRVSADMQDEVKSSRALYSAAKKEAWDSAMWAVNHHGMVQAAAQPFTHLGWSVGKLREELAANASPNRIRAAAENVVAADNIRRSEVADILATDVTTSGMFGELVRLRAAMRAAGELLHLAHGISTGGRCECPGCEMTRTVHLAEHPDAPAGTECTNCGVSRASCAKLDAARAGSRFRKCCHACHVRDTHPAAGGE